MQTGFRPLPVYRSLSTFTSPRLARCALPLALTAVFGSAHAAEPTVLDTVNVIDFRGEQMDSVKYARDLQDTPRLITVLPSDLLEEQNATSLKDALKNIPGISLQAGEGNPPGGDQFKIRGFNARDDINVNDTRDLGNYFRDPFYIDQLEVVKGPNSAFSGRGSAGGTVNFVTKKPSLTNANRVEASIGTDSYYRLTADLNRALDDNSAVRINLMGHDADIPGRDIAEEQRYGLYAAYTWGFKGPTRIMADYLHMTQDDLPDAGLPMDREPFRASGGSAGRGLGTGGLPPGIDFDNFYGHTDDYKDISVNQFGLALQHAFGNGIVLKNQFRLSRVTNDSITSSPRFRGLGAVDFTGGMAVGNTKPRDQTDDGINNQTDLLFNFKTGSVEHDLVVGMELAQYEFENRRRLDLFGPLTDLYNPLPRVGPIHTYDGTTYKLETKEIGIYVLDTMKLSEKWDFTAGLRWDDVEATASRRGFTGANVGLNGAEKRDDSEISYNLGLVYKLQPNASLFASYGNAYVFSANFDRNSIQLAGGNPVEPIVGAGFRTPPENIQAFELGAKWTVAAGLDLGAAIFRTDTSEGRFPGQEAGALATPNADYVIDGFEFLAAGKITEKWRVYAGYTFLQSDIKASPSSGVNEAYVTSQELGGTPEHSFNLFTTYDVTPKISVGGGMQYVDSVTSGVDPAPPSLASPNNVTVTVDDYTTFDFYATYKFTKQTQVRMNVLNAFDERYISQLAEGGSQGIPGRGRQAILTVRHDF